MKKSNWRRSKSKEINCRLLKEKLECDSQKVENLAKKWKTLKTKRKDKEAIRKQLKPLKQEFEDQMRRLEELEQESLQSAFEREKRELKYYQKLRKINLEVNEEANQTRKEIDEYMQRRETNLERLEIV